jgi:hypothetical protein
MAIIPKHEPGDLVETTIAGVRYVALVLSTTRAPRRGMSPMVQVQWVGNSPRDYSVEYVEDHAVKPVK